jgi:hypothetical protein
VALSIAGAMTCGYCAQALSAAQMVRELKLRGLWDGSLLSRPTLPIDPTGRWPRRRALLLIVHKGNPNAAMRRALAEYVVLRTCTRMLA